MESDLPPPPYDSCVLKNKGADILVQNAYKNQIWSPLLRLPDKTLIVLMKSLDLDSLLRLRHTSRIFMWLFSSDAGFEQHHLTPDEDEDRFYDTARIWTPPSLWFKNQAASSFGSMCSKCATKRKGDDSGKALLEFMSELYCSRCRTKHRSMHFSSGQRLLPESSDRICIGHEGYFVLCNHVPTMTWHQVTSREHTPLEELRCINQEHFHPSLRCDIDTCAQDRFPSFFVSRNDHDGLFMDLLHARHIFVTRLPSGKMCAESLRKAFEEEPRGMSATQWMPQLWPVAGNPLRIFDPNLCDCVEWRGSSPEAKHMRWPLCPDPAKPWRSAADADLFVSTQPRCSQYSHSIAAGSTGAEAKIWVEHCQGRDDLLVLVQSIRYYISEACSSGWQDIVHHQSYGMALDEDMRGVTWCPNPTCAVSNLRQSNKHLWNIETRDRMGSEWPRQFVCP